MDTERISFQCRDGRPISIEIDDDNYSITARDARYQEIGRLEFREVDGPHPALKLTWAYLDKLGPTYTRQGIGRECIRLAKDHFGLPICAEGDDGIRKDDGSHLTGDAPAFIARLREEGLIVPSIE